MLLSIRRRRTEASLQSGCLPPSPWDRAVPSQAVLETNHLGLFCLSPSGLCFSSPIYHKPSGLHTHGLPISFGFPPVRGWVPKRGTSVLQDFIRNCPSKSQRTFPTSPRVSGVGQSLTRWLCDVQINQRLSRSRDIFLQRMPRGGCGGHADAEQPRASLAWDPSKVF